MVTLLTKTNLTGSRLPSREYQEDLDLRRRHWTCNAIIDGDGETARLRAYIIAIEYSKSLTPYLMGEYDDSLIKVDGK